jgi:hypothetical protein
MERKRRRAVLDRGQDGPPQKKTFPRLLQSANQMFVDGVVFRDNSHYLKHFFSAQSILFTRPMQLGKTTLFSLADDIFSKNRPMMNVPLKFEVEQKDRNSWYVLSLNFGPVKVDVSDVDWKKHDEFARVGKNLDDAARRLIKVAVFELLEKKLRPQERFQGIGIGKTEN